MFISVKRHEREKQALVGISNRLTDALLATAGQGFFLLGAADQILPPVSRSLAALFRRADFADVPFEQMLAPVVTAKTLTAFRMHIATLRSARAAHTGTADAPAPAPVTQFFSNVEVRLPNPDGSFESAHYSFEFDPVELGPEPTGDAPVWLVRVTDITTRVHAHRELDELRCQVQAQGEILRGVLRLGGARFAGLTRSTGASMKTIATVLKKPAREAQAFRLKLEGILHEVDRIRREASAFGLTALESAARIFEEALQELRSRSTSSGSDFLPLAVKMDQLYDQYALLQSLTTASAPVRVSDASVEETRAHRTAAAGSLDRTLQALTDHVAQTYDKRVILECSGLDLVPQRYQSAIKNVAIQLIRNAVMHGIESPAARAAADKPAHGTLRLGFKTHGDHFEFRFEDDGCGLVADHVRSTAIARGVVTAEAAARLRDREAIKLIFKSRYTTLSRFAGRSTHGAGMALVRRYVQDAGGKIALASLPGRETRFRITLPLLAGARTEPGTAMQVPSNAQAAGGTPAVDTTSAAAADAQTATDAHAAA
ncbi:MAG: ATP-binding protein [Pseudomonadota bacterium]|nr:ATP-binding protein [Pseudomonadota bacterium]